MVCDGIYRGFVVEVYREMRSRHAGMKEILQVIKTCAGLSTRACPWAGFVARPRQTFAKCLCSRCDFQEWQAWYIGCWSAMSIANGSSRQGRQASRSRSRSPQLNQRRLEEAAPSDSSWARRQIEILPYISEPPRDFRGTIFVRTGVLAFRPIDPLPPRAIPPTPSGSNILRSSVDLTADGDTAAGTGRAAGILPPLEEFEAMSQDEKMHCLYMAVLRLQHLSR